MPMHSTNTPHQSSRSSRHTSETICISRSMVADANHTIFCTLAQSSSVSQSWCQSHPL